MKRCFLVITFLFAAAMIIASGAEALAEPTCRDLCLSECCTDTTCAKKKQSECYSDCMRSCEYQKTQPKPAYKPPNS